MELNPQQIAFGANWTYPLFLFMPIWLCHTCQQRVFRPTTFNNRHNIIIGVGCTWYYHRKKSLCDSAHCLKRISMEIWAMTIFEVAMLLYMVQFFFFAQNTIGAFDFCCRCRVNKTAMMHLNWPIVNTIRRSAVRVLWLKTKKIMELILVFHFW